MSRHKVHIWPEGKTFEMDEKESMLEALKREGFFIKSTCGGMATCGDCVVKIKGGEDYLMPPTFSELKLLGNVFHITKERLSCQTKIKGDVSIDISKHASEGPGHVVSSKPYVKTNLRKKSAQAASPSQGQQRPRDEGGPPPAPREPGWFRHWEKDKTSENAHKKGRGGNRRPKAFKFSTTTSESSADSSGETSGHFNKDSKENTEEKK